jgi:hypothetical protein
MEIYELTGDDLRTFLEEMTYRTNEIRIVRVAFDEGTFKFKVNESTWSPPIGKRKK